MSFAIVVWTEGVFFIQLSLVKDLKDKSLVKGLSFHFFLILIGFELITKNMWDSLNIVRKSSFFKRTWKGLVVRFRCIHTSNSLEESKTWKVSKWPIVSRCPEHSLEVSKINSLEVTNRHEVVESRDGRVSKYPDTVLALMGTCHFFALICIFNIRPEFCSYFIILK